MTKLKVSKKCPAVGALATAEAVKGSMNIAVTWADETSYTMDGGSIGSTTAVGIARCIARQVSSTGLYGQDILSQTEVDHWLSFCLGPLSCLSELKNAINYLDNVLKPATFLVGKAVTIADYCVFGALNRSPQWLFMVEKNQAPSSLLRWYKMMSSRPEIQSVTKSLPAEAKITPAPLGDPNKEKKEESAGGKFVDLPGAEEGKVIVRFPPEASGFLHVGHAKAALLNNHYKESFKGKLIMRFDDTNPAKEKEEYEEVILEDLKMLQVKYDHFSRTSDHFEIMLMYCEKLLKEGKAYVDDTDAETMKAEREAKKDSKNRNNSVAVNMKMWEEMKKGSDVGVKCAVRAKIDMQSANGCLRDPTIYRCKPEPHPATGTRYKVYPTYDFACPIVDSVEGVTHSLRTTEYMDRDDQFYWFINALGLRKPYIWAYARLNLTNTVMSKRKLTWLVDEGIVDGWDDPRLPTVRGVLRRGLTVEALKQFIVAQGSSRSVVFMEWDKIWAFNKKVLDPVVPRHTTVDRSYRVPVNVAGAKLNSISAARHPKNPDIGEKTVWTGPVLTIDGVDAEQLKEGDNATFINWGNLMIKKVNKSNGKVVSVDAEDNTSNKDFKKTLKLTWLCENEEKSPFTPSLLIYYDHIISKAILDKDDDFKNFVGQDSKHEVEMLGDLELKNLKKGDMVQIQRRGYFICDVPYAPYDQSVGKPRPVVLIAIPDGTPNSYGPPGKSAAPAAPSKAKEAGGKSAGKAKPQKAAAPAKVEGAGAVDKVLNDIKAQGDKVRTMKEAKADKASVGEAVKVLLDLKAQYKQLTGKDWTPTATAPAAAPAAAAAPSAAAAGGVEKVLNDIKAQGDKVRTMKEAKADKAAVGEAVKVLLDLKAQYKQLTGKDWTPNATAPAAAPAVTAAPSAAVGGVDKVLSDIKAQGDKVRTMKEAKADKAAVGEAVKVLLDLKAQYKQLTGKDWTPNATASAAPAAAPKAAAANSASSGGAFADINNKIVAQGDIVRRLKTEKADKADIDANVKILLQLKADFKASTGQDWKPGMNPPEPKAESGSSDDLDSKIRSQGDKVRKLKGEKADKKEIDEAVKVLLALKADFKAANGIDWKPDMPAAAKTVPVKQEPVAAAAGPGAEINAKITEQGNLVRDLKSKKADKGEIDAAVKVLLDLKAQYKTATGEDWKPAGGAPAAKPKQEKKEKQKEKPAPAVPAAGVTRLGIEAKKEDNLPEWYAQVLTKSEMLDYYDVSGCYILRPWSYAIWESIKDFFDGEIKKLDVENCYFPCFVSKAALEKEETHIDDFAPEVAWVTKSGNTDLAEPIAIRPTSETVMYPAYAKWIQSYRDLPVKLNQWNNVVRWEFKHPQPFLRTREFLWQEGHTAFATKKEAEDEVMVILTLYKRVYEELLAVPVVPGRKTEKEKFAGGDFTADAALAGLPALVSLDLAENRLAAIPPAVFKPVPALERLFLENNSLAILTAETFTPLDNLLQLNLSANALTSNIVAGDIFYPLTKLVALDLSHNKITSIPDSMFRQQVVLQILNLSHNKISSIAEGSLQALANLHILLLSYNLLSTLPPTILHSLPSLKSLSLDHNQLIRLPEQLFTSSPHLQDLSLNQNRLEQIPAGIDQLVSIRTLDLGENRIADFSTSSMDDPNGGKLSDERNAASKVFHRLSALYGLRLAGNRLTEIPAQIFQANSNLHVLNLAHNSLANISRESFQKLNNLRALRLDNNNLTNINGLVGSLKNLKWLNVSENELQWFDFAFIPKSLEWLDVHNNNIDTIGNYYNLGDGFSLKTFDASYNRIETLSSDTLLHSLHSIYLNNNRIKSVAAGSFRELSQLRRVELQDNQLAHLEMSAVELSYSGESAPEFLVGGNPWSCDCELEWLKNVNQLRGTGSYPRILDLDTIMCSTTSSSSQFLMSSSPSSFPPPRQDSSSYKNNNHVAVQQQNGSSSVPLLHMRSDQFVCEYDAHCIPQCYCCDFFACDCRMQCPEGCSCYHDNSWTNNVIQCSGRGHMDVPPLIPMDATAVYLDGNNMTELANPGFIGRRRVRAVYLNNSMIVRVTNYSFEGLTEVSVLHLEDNQIKTLAGNEFTGLAKLQQLYLQNNFLTSIAAQTFAGLRDLTVLRLDGNLLTSFPVWQLNNPLLSHLYLGRNSWTCECEYVRPFLQFRQKFAGKIVDLTESSVKCVTTAGAEALSVMSTVACTTSGVLQPSTTSSGGGGGTTVSTTGSITDYTPILVSVLLVVLILIIGYLLTFTFRKTIRSWFVGGVTKTRRSAAGTTVSGMSAIAGTATGDRACSDNNAGSVYSTSNDKLFDVFISYAPEDGDLVEGSLAANLEHGATSYRLCLHQRDFPPTTPLADTVSVAVETSTRAVIVLSRAYLATQWVNIRPSFMKAIKDNNTKVVFIQVEQQLDADHAVDDLLSAAPELRNLREDSPCVHWQDPNFWSKLRYFLPEPVYLTFHRSVTMRGTLQQQQQNPAAGNLYQPVMPYPARIELLATNYINSGHNCVETDHSTDTTTMTAVSPLHSVYAVSGGGGTAGSEHTYHSIDNNHIYHTLDPGPPSAATANLFHLQFHHSSTPAAAGQPAARSSPGFPAHVLNAGLQPPALHHNNRSANAHHQHHHGSHTPSNSTCSAKRLLSGDQGEYIV